MALSRVINFVFPHLCPGCHTVMSSQGFCPLCWSKIIFMTPPQCALCGQPFAVLTQALCLQCQKWIPLFNSHRSLWHYGPLSRKVIFALKHGRQRYLAPLLATWLLPLMLSVRVDCIVPVPLHPHRLAQRGFNQSCILAQELSRMTLIPLVREGLIRRFKTPSQGRFSLSQRRDNVDGAFSSSYQWDGAAVMLIDDVYTTGSTLNACTHALKEAGALHVHALTLAKVTS
jgi:ComF family protein